MQCRVEPGAPSLLFSELACPFPVFPGEHQITAGHLDALLRTRMRNRSSGATPPFGELALREIRRRMARQALDGFGIGEVRAHPPTEGVRRAQRELEAWRHCSAQESSFLHEERRKFYEPFIFNVSVAGRPVDAHCLGPSRDRECGRDFPRGPGMPFRSDTRRGPVRGTTLLGRVVGWRLAEGRACGFLPRFRRQVLGLRVLYVDVPGAYLLHLILCLRPKQAALLARCTYFGLAIATSIWPPGCMDPVWSCKYVPYQR